MAAAARYGLELTGQNKVSQETFDAAVAVLGYRGTTEFTTVMATSDWSVSTPMPVTLTFPSIGLRLTYRYSVGEMADVVGSIDERPCRSQPGPLKMGYDGRWSGKSSRGSAGDA